MPRTLSPVPLTAIVCLAEVFSMTGTAVVPALATVLKQTWGLNNTEAGWILGTYWVGYVIAVPVLSGLTDRVAPGLCTGYRSPSAFSAVWVLLILRKVYGRRSYFIR